MSIGSTPWLHKNSVAVTKNYYAIKSLTFWGHIINSPFFIFLFILISRTFLYKLYEVRISSREAFLPPHQLLPEESDTEVL